ncbi:MAG: cysteine dioxygenase family protein [Cyanobacteria bacterium P01_A01_bin.17]
MMKTDVVPASLGRLARIQTLIRSLECRTVITPEIAKDCVQAANIQAADLQLWTDFEHPVANSYGRQLIYDGGHFEIMVMSWLPGDYSAIHDHGAAQWGAVQSFGEAEHAVFRLDQMQLSTVSVHPFSAGTINVVTHDLIHQMGNSSNQPFLSLHVYGSLGNHGPVTGGARIFNLYEECTQYTDGGVFFGLPAHQITRQVNGLRGDRETTLRHHEQMLARVHRRLAHGEDTILLLQTATMLQQYLADFKTMTSHV